MCVVVGTGQADELDPRLMCCGMVPWGSQGLRDCESWRRLRPAGIGKYLRELREPPWMSDGQESPADSGEGCYCRHCD